MKDMVIVRSKTINNESVPVVIKVIEPFTGEQEQRELTRPVVFSDFQAEVPIDVARSLVKQNPDEFFIVDAKGELSERAEEIVKTAKEKLEGFKCQYCGLEAKSKAGLLAHIRYNHPEGWKK